MTPRIKSYKRLAASLGLAAVLATAVAAPAFAASDDANMEVGITAGTRTVTIADPVFADNQLDYSTSAQTVTTVGGTASALQVEDLTGSGEAWEVTVTSTGLSANEGADTISGGDIDVTPGTITTGDAATAGLGGTLDQERTVMSAAADSGDGVHSLDLDVEITVPGSQKPGTYTGTLTVTEAPVV